MSHDIWERSRVLESYRPGLLLHLRKFAKPLLAYFIISQMEKLPALLDLCAQPCVCVCVCQGIFSTQGSNLCLLYWQADSLPLSHQGSQEHFISYSKENSHNSGARSKYPFYGVNFQGLLKTSSYSYQQDGVLGSSALIYPKETLL